MQAAAEAFSTQATWAVNLGINGKAMKIRLAAVIILLNTSAFAAPSSMDLPSCNLTEQRALDGQTGGSVTDRNQAHIALRSNILQADIGTSRKARHLSQKQADELFQRIERIRSDSTGFVQTQGFLSAGERASYDRELDTIAGQVCKR